MKIQLMSDLHFEFHDDAGKYFISTLPKNGDVIIIAGDLCSHSLIQQSLTMLSKHFSKQEIIYVLGNHELYGANRNGYDGVIAKTQRFVRTLDNVNFLENESIKIQNQVFHGTTLWFSHSGEIEQFDSNMNDFFSIKDIYEWIGTAEETAIRFLQNNVKEEDIVVTHHLPSNVCVHPKYARSELNRYFVSDNAEQILRNQKHKLHFHGHTHCSVDTSFMNTRICCNPCGYFGYDVNPNFKESYIIEI